jgi:hypothetical protein
MFRAYIAHHQEVYTVYVQKLEHVRFKLTVNNKYPKYGFSRKSVQLKSRCFMQMDVRKDRHDEDASRLSQLIFGRA